MTTQSFNISVAPGAPATPDLATASDSGSSSSDNITSSTTPSFTGTAVVGATVKLYDTNGTTEIGTATADQSGNWSITSSTLSAGAHTIQAKQTVGGAASVISTGLSVTIDTAAPTKTVSGIGLWADTGSSSTDFNTATAAQTITATLSATLSGDELWGSLDNGATWTNISSMVSGTALSWNAVTLSGSNTLKLQVRDVAGNAGTTLSQAYVLDTSVDTPTVALTTDAGASDSDLITNDGTLTVTGENGATIEYSTDNTNWTSSFTPASGSNTVYVRQTDMAGNVSTASAAYTFTLDTAVPSAPTLALTTDSGNSTTDKISSDSALTVSGTETDATVEFSTDGTTWASSFTPAEGSNTVYVRQTDVAGNVSTASAAYTFTLDTVVSAPTLALTADTGSSASDMISSDATLTLSGTETGATVEYSTDATTWVSTFTPAEGGNTVYVRQTDLAGNVATASTAYTFALDNTPPAFQSAATNADGSKVILTYDSALGSTTATAGQFAITIGGNAVTVTGGVVNGGTVELTLQTAAVAGQPVTVAYTDPTSGDDANAVQDVAGNDAGTLAVTTVTEQVDSTPPAYQSASVNGTGLTLTYGENLAGTAPATSAFTIKVDGTVVTNALSAVAIDGTDAHKLNLTLANPLYFGQTMTVSYTAPAVDNTTANAAIQDAAGNDALSLSEYGVSNSSAATSSQVVGSQMQGEQVTLAVGGGFSINNPVNSAAPTNLGKSVKMPLGKFAFNITGVGNGGTAQLSMTADADLKQLTYYKFNYLTNKFTNIAKTAAIDRGVDGIAGNADDRATVFFELTDGGAYDADRTVNGTIVDPGGLAENTLLPLLLENTTAVGDVTLQDTAQVNGTLGYTITGGLDAAKFSVNASTGALRFLSAPNYEAPTDLGNTAGNNTYTVNVAITGSNGGSELQSLVVTVLNVPEAGDSTVGSNVTSTEVATVVTPAPANVPPVGSVTISGTPTQGQTLSVSHNMSDADGPSILNVSYQWQADGVDISGATGNTLSLGASQVGQTITVLAQYTDGRGTTEGLSSAPTASVASLDGSPTGSVSITGAPTQGQSLTASNSLNDANGLGSISYQWQANGVDIAGGTGTNLVLSQEQVGKAISVAARYTDGAGNAESKASGVTTAVTNTNDAPTGGVTITGTPTQGQTLAASNNLADPDGPGTLTVSYQWQTNGLDIGGATSATLVLGPEQVGKAISVTARYTDGGGTTESISSNSTGVVVNTNDTPIGTVTISGTATLGQTLTAANTLTDADGPATLTIGYQWQANGVNISGATSATLVLGSDQLGKAITIVASYTDAQGAAERVSSAATAAVANIPNSAPTLALSAVLSDNHILENTSTATHIEVANIVITDDTQGTNTLSLTGADAASFEIVGTALYLKAGVVLDFESQTSYQLAVQVADASLPASTPAAASYTLNVVNVIEGTPVTPQPNPTPIVPPVTEWPSLPDDDGDGTPEALEGFVKPLDVTGAVAGDGNGDGQADALQQSVASVPFLNTPTAISSPGVASSVFVSLVADALNGKPDTTDTNTAKLENVVQKDAPANLPSLVKMPLGLISFDAVVGLSGTAGIGVTETFSLYVDSTLGINGYWKLDASSTWVNLASSVYGGAMVTEGGKTRLDFRITDGGQFDADHTVNGTIVDPGAAGFVPLSMVGYAPDAGISLVGYVPELPAGGFWF